MEEKTVYYTDPLKDEFSGFGEKPKVTVDGKFRYENRNIFYRIGRFFVYRVVMTPVAWLYGKIKFHLNIVGREKLRVCRKSGFFLYGNHTQTPGDGFIPNMLAFPHDVSFIVNPDNIAAPGTRTLMMMLGTLPIPTAFGGFPNFTKAIAARLARGEVITVYPEAHIWPYCSRIRPFPATSFLYPAKDGLPVFCFTNTYRRSKHGHPRIVSYLDGPFVSVAQTDRERRDDLHRQVYAAMCARAEQPENYAFIRYEKRPEAKQREESTV